ncbi:hypothetical protein FMM74_022040 [Lachnospiraceae bacterium MD308]|nr:hypothetical protein [Lachnospiraceae bacterium MD308]
MRKNNIRAKKLTEITIEDHVNIINTIVQAHFQIDEDGGIKYTPYFSKIGKIIAITKYMIEGIEFDKDENIYSTVVNDVEVNTLINNILTLPDFKTFINDVNDIVEYKKAENIARIQNESSSIITYKLLELIEKEEEKMEKEYEALSNLNNWINEQRELNSLITPEMQRSFAESFDPEALTDAIIKKYAESDVHVKNKEIVNANKKLREKDNKIVKLEKELKKRDQKNNVKNVISDK